jgi:hypothetical protein
MCENRGILFSGFFINNTISILYCHKETSDEDVGIFIEWDTPQPETGVPPYQGGVKIGSFER